MKNNEQTPNPETWQKVIKVAIAILTALLGLFGASAVGASLWGA